MPDNGLSDTSASGHRSYAARIFATPFQAGGESPLSGLGFGMAAEGGNLDGIALPAYKTVGQNTFFTFASGVTAAVIAQRWSRRRSTMRGRLACSPKTR